MDASERRSRLLELLAAAEKPISASALAERLSVSRQIIVGDIALLRAAGHNIMSTPRGYLPEREQGGLARSIVCRHDAAGMERELNIIVDNGCTVLDVSVEHPVYGQLTGQLRLASRHDVRQFIERISENGARPLSALTGGIHLHKLLCPDEAALLRVKAELAAAGVLLPED